MLKAIESGYVQREIQEAAYDFQRALETEAAIVVGVNKYRIEEDETISILRVDPQIESDQVERVKGVREKRDDKIAQNAIQRIEAAAGHDSNLLPLILDAVESNVTVGEISNALRRVWGEYEEALTI
jgi:methylmalonyl-CoA mutase N-terminal domain/subunit